MLLLIALPCAAAGPLLDPPSAVAAEEERLPAFRRLRLDETFYGEGATFGDLDRDGDGDVISGPYWYEGPAFEERHEIYEPRAFDPLGYSDNFFAWVRDFDADGWLDVLVVGFPGQQAAWYENPDGGDGRWTRHVAFEVVDNESPAFVDLTGDGSPELCFHTGGRLGWAGPDPEKPAEPWRFHPISADIGLAMFTHGFGVGDVDGDGRMDVLLRAGWWEQPDSLAGDAPWTHHEVDFAAGRRGGAQMHAYDVDGDGDSDVITSLDAHGWGLSWFEQVPAEGGIAFREHRILDERAPGSDAETFSQLHALDLADVDGDGLLDIVTGKRRWAHGNEGDPEPNGPPVLYWLRLARDDERGVAWTPHQIDDGSGVGVQVVAGDVDGDGRTDVVVGNKLGTFVFLQGAQHKLETGALELGFESGTLAGWTATGDAFDGQPVRGDAISARGLSERSRHAGEYWIGGYELHGDGRTGTLTSEVFEVTHPWASFLVGGGHHETTCVELVRESDGSLLHRVSGPDREALQRAVVDLRQEQGERIRVRLVDEHDGSWGHVNFDDFLFYAAEPHFAQDESLPDLREYTSVAHSGLSPEEAVRAMTVPEGFTVELIAGEPDLHQPIALAIDHRGRIWVAEARSYPERRPEGEGLDDILVFDNADTDGTFERRVVFAEGLNLVSGLEVGFGGAWVGAAPYLLFIPDADGDLVPDGEPEVLLDGWGYEDTHETLNAFTWGPDGWLYGCHGVFTHSRVGKPGTPDAERVPLDAGVWRYHPTRHELEVFAWGTSNPWGIDFDANGQAFITACVIPHLYHVVQGGRYQRQGGEHFDPFVFEDLQTIADHQHYAGNIGDHAWWGRDEPVHYESTLAAGGGHAHCGALIYQGDQWPEEYRGTLLVGNVHGNRFNNEELVREGSGFVGRHRPDFLLANDEWFRGINLKQGPDGSVYFIDWYDQRACHRTDSEGWDRTNGRLYRVRHPSRASPLDPAEAEVVRTLLADLGIPEIAEVAGTRNEWLWRATRLRFQEGGFDLETRQSLLQSLREEGDPRRKLRIMWALHSLGSLGLAEQAKLELVASGDEYLQAWAIQLDLEDRFVTPAVHDELVRLSRESSSPVVRLYLASGLQRLAVHRRWEIAAGLASHTEDDLDHNIPLMLWYGVEPLVAEDPARALALAREAQIGTLRRFVPRRAAHEEAAHEALVAEIVGAEGDWLRTLLGETMIAFGEKRIESMPAGWPELYARLAASDDPDVRERAFSIAVAFGDRAVFPELRRILADPAAELARRERALDDLLRGKDEQSVPILLALLDEEALRGRAIRALASFADAGIPAALLEGYAGFGLEERRDARNTLAARVPSALALLDAVDQGHIARAELDAVTLRQIGALADPELDARIAEVWGVLRPTAEEKRAEIARWKELLSADALAAADLSSGRDAYERTCAQCHVLFGAGGDVGPDITGSNRADLDYLLETIVDPNALIPKEYQVTTVRLVDGRVVSGIAKRETDDALALVNQTETALVWKHEIEERVPQEVSMMPEGQLATLGEEEVRDLVAYLASPAQVPLRATPANVERFFDGSTLAGWRGDPACWRVEDGEIVGRTAGLERNEFLKSDLLLADFRLVVDVRLAGDQGNSGIQLRSAELEGGDVRGYQADIGAGWWGKLYEEHGRGLLAEPEDAARVVSDGWNTYEILAAGERVRTALNGRACIDLVDPEGARRGIIALQIHSGGPTEIRFRNPRLELDPSSELVTLREE